MIPNDTKALLKPGTIRDFCDAYDEAVRMVDEALAQLANAKARLKRVIERPHILPDRTSDWDIENDGAKRLRDACRDRMTRCAWGEIVRLTRVGDVMVERKRKDLDARIERGDVPPLTYENVCALLEGLRGDLGGIIRETIEEAARILRPNNERYATNGDGWRLGRKAVVEWAVDWCDYSAGSFDVRYGSGETKLMTIDRAFHLLDGKGVPEHPDRLVDAMRAAMKARQQEVTTAYFRVKWFKNRNAHFEFLRQDLVDELNAQAADHTSLREPAAV